MCSRDVLQFSWIYIYIFLRHVVKHGVKRTCGVFFTTPHHSFGESPISGQFSERPGLSKASSSARVAWADLWTSNRLCVCFFFGGGREGFAIIMKHDNTTFLFFQTRGDTTLRHLFFSRMIPVNI